MKMDQLTQNYVMLVKKVEILTVGVMKTILLILPKFVRLVRATPKMKLVITQVMVQRIVTVKQTIK